ncbi:transcriptional regulator, partial [Streptomyces platensis subsp. clarensis]|nr:transcriptional regulator [Streptomyces platensis subsp. clarensis]
AQAARESLAGHPETRARRRAIGLALLATAQVQQREVEQACQTGTRALELLATLRSSRGMEYLEDLRDRLEPYAGEAVVREFGARLELHAA